MDVSTLRGRRKDVYVLLKKLKYAMDSDAKSYDAKYSVDMTIHSEDPSNSMG